MRKFRLSPSDRPSRARMDPAALAKLHESLEAGMKDRGARGGLGTHGKEKKQKVETTEASKTLLGGKGGKDRSFHSTTAGAVAAGHWDPWARPVAFKMKEVNRQVGGLYSMFVKGDTMGGSLQPGKEEKEAMKEKKEKKAKKEKQAKKEKKEKAAASAAVATDGPVGGEEEAAAFNWKKSIKTQLRAAEGQQLPLKRLRKATVAACQAHGGAAAKEELRATFDKKLAKLAGVVETVGDSVRLAGEPK